MSSFIRATKRPGTGAYENAFWVDNMYGGHRYGVVFPNSGDNTGVAYKADDHKWEFDDERVTPELSWDKYPKIIKNL